MTALLTPTDPKFYANHSAAALGAVIKKAADSGQYIAINSGANHPMAVEWAGIYAAASAAFIERELA